MSSTGRRFADDEPSDDALMRVLLSGMVDIACTVESKHASSSDVDVTNPNASTSTTQVASSADVTILPESMYGIKYDDNMKAIGEKLAATGCHTTGKKYYRVLRGKPWTVGYMIDSDSVSTMDEQFPGRLFVYEEEQIPMYLDQGDHLAVVEIPELADVSKGFRKINTNMLKVLEVISLGDWYKWSDVEFCFAMLWRNPGCFKYMTNQTYDMCEFAIQRDVSNFQHVVDKTPAMYKILIRSWPAELKNVPREMIDEDLCEIAVERNGMSLEFVPEEFKTRSLCEQAVRTVDDEDDTTHQHIYGERCFCCSNQDRLFDRTIRGHALKFVPIKFHDTSMYRIAKMLSGMRRADLIDYEMCRCAVALDGLELKYVPSRLLDKNLTRIAVDQNSHALEFVPVDMQTPALCMGALKRSVTSLQFIKNPTQKQVAYALKKDPDAWQYIKE